MTTATLSAPHAPHIAPPAPTPADDSPASLAWEVNAEGCLVGRDGPGRALARIGLHTAGGSPDAVAQAARRAVADTITTPLRERIAALPSLARYATLRAEVGDVLGRAADVEVSLRRAVAEREEVVALARPGFSARLAVLDVEIADLSSRKADLDARYGSLSGPVRDARAVAGRDAEAIRERLNHEAAHALNARRLELAGRLGPLVGAVLTELLGTVDALHGCTVGQHGADVVRDLDGIAFGTAGGAE